MQNPLQPVLSIPIRNQLFAGVLDLGMPTPEIPGHSRSGELKNEHRCSFDEEGDAKKLLDQSRLKLLE